jgi:hypothetical protein
MDRDDHLKFWMTVIGIILTLAILAIFATVKYNCCMDVKNDHDECVYDVACNTG